jgi:serine/threonine protein kinase
MTHSSTIFIKKEHPLQEPSVLDFQADIYLIINLISLDFNFDEALEFFDNYDELDNLSHEITLSDRVTKATGFSFVEQQKLYQTRTRREVDRVTKKKVYYKEWQETYVAIVTQFVAKCQKLTGDAQQDRDLIERFEKEAVALQRIGSSHGQVPSLFDYFDFEGNFYLIQELVRGQTLMDAFIELAQEGYVFSERKAVEIIASLLEILEHIHEQGLIHRDIKPQNIILR